MTNPALAFISRYATPDLWPRVKDMASGLVEDFWTDGPENPFDKILKRKSADASLFDTAVHQAARNGQAPVAAAGPQQWRAAPGEVAEKMWGEGDQFPDEAAILAKMVEPMSLKKRMSVLHLSAGLGHCARLLNENFGVLVTGLEPNPEIAVRAMNLLGPSRKGAPVTIANYNPATFNLDKPYDAIVLREIFYGIADKPRFLKSLSVCAKPGAHVSFLDYVVDPQQQDAPAIMAWKKHERQSMPIGLIEMGETWVRAGFHIINQEDITAAYKKQVLKGLQNLAVFLATSRKPDAATRAEIRKQLELWAHRVAAIQGGMRVFRFLGIKQA